MAIIVNLNPSKDRVCAISRVYLRRGRLPCAGRSAHARGCASVAAQGMCDIQGLPATQPACFARLRTCPRHVLRRDAPCVAAALSSCTCPNMHMPLRENCQIW